MKRMLMRKSVTKMAGLTLLETMFAIAIGALVVIAAVIFYTSTKNSQNASKAVTDINTIVAQADNYIAPGSAALSDLKTLNSGDAVKTLQAAGYLPTTLSDPWGGTYSGAVTINAGANLGVPGTIAISISSLVSSDAACNAVATASQGLNTDAKDPDSGDAGACAIQRDL